MVHETHTRRRRTVRSPSVIHIAVLDHGKSVRSRYCTVEANY